MNGLNEFICITDADVPPINLEKYDARGKRIGLVVVDEVEGFCIPGKGNLAPPAGAMPWMIERMIRNTSSLAESFRARNFPILVLRDSHIKGVPEPPYPEHCVEGTGEDLLVPQLQWLAACNGVMHLRKDCLDGFIAGIWDGDGQNSVVNWVNAENVEALVVVGICTDICVADFVCTMLSARNHFLAVGRSKLMPKLQDVVVFEPACSTYDLPRAAALAAGLPAQATHPVHFMHHMGLYIMASRGAMLASSIVL